MSATDPITRRTAKAAIRRVNNAVLKRRSARRAFGAFGLRVTGTGAPLPMGASFPSGHAPTAPIVVVVGVGLDEDVLRSSLRRLADIQLATSSFRVLVITDTMALDPVRETGWAVERILSESEFEAVGAGPWISYVTGHVAGAVESYGAASVLPVPLHGLADTAWAALLTLASTPG